MPNVKVYQVTLTAAVEAPSARKALEAFLKRFRVDQGQISGDVVLEAKARNAEPAGLGGARDRAPRVTD